MALTQVQPGMLTGNNPAIPTSTAVGTQALNSNSAAFNTAVGYQAKFTGTGGYNTCFGAGAGSAFSTGAENTLVGYYAGGSLTTGNKNLFIGGAQGNGSGGLITTGNSNVVIGSYSGNQGGLDIRTASNRIVLSDGDGNIRGYFDNQGSFGVATTVFDGSGGGHAVNMAAGSGAYLQTSHTSGAGDGYTYHAFNWNNGNIGQIVQNGTTGVTYSTTSDYRLKENVQPITGALAKVQSLKPVTYTWKNSPDEVGEGFIAHELAEVCPLAVTGEKDAVNEDGSIKPQGIDTSFLVATLTAAIQELNAKVDAQAAEIAALKAAP